MSTRKRTLRDEIRRIVGERPGIVRHVIAERLMSDEDLVAELDMSPEKIAGTLYRMTHTGQIRRDEGGHYHLVAEGERRSRRAERARQQEPPSADEPAPPAPAPRPESPSQGPRFPSEPRPRGVPEKMLALVYAAEVALADYIESRGDPVLNALLESARRARDAVAEHQERLG